ncbi:tyrosine-type recombinase/integrase [Pararhizobium haloflavum]|uniref:tyrosine-type recombinase/integrase n=1 Tax=Pararhizobium haloflavum TaxID=2037914 RepID=UPI000C19A82A|nr:integrase arm-type DNA-binding domain-containing protein [Pararhizobium haloflavum]
MPKLTKRVVDSLQSTGAKTGTLHWDSELKGFAVRVLPSGRKTFVIKFRARNGRQRWLKLGAYGPLTAERAREIAKMELAKVVEGQDPAADRDERREASTISQLCDLYMEAANAGLVLGRRGTPKKTSTLLTDKSRIDAHIKPLLGRHIAREVKRTDIEQLRNGVVAGKAARDKKLGYRSRSIVKGGKGAATRTLGLLGAIFAWGVEAGHVATNPVRGVRRFSDNQKKALLSGEQYHLLAKSLSFLESKRDRNGKPLHSAIGIAAIRFIALSGLRRGECEQLRWDEVDANGACLALEETKTGFSLRPLSRTAFAIIDELDPISDFVFVSEPEGAGYKGLPNLWRTVQNTARHLASVTPAQPDQPLQDKATLDGLTLHSLRHSFAGVSEELGASIPTIAALLGHQLKGVTSGYILKRVDVLLVDAANRAGDHIAKLMRGEAPASPIVQFKSRGRNSARNDGRSTLKNRAPVTVFPA